MSDTVERVNGRDAAYWHGSYCLLRDAIVEHLHDFCQDGEEAEEALAIAAIERAAAAGMRLEERLAASASQLSALKEERDEWRTAVEEKNRYLAKVEAEADAELEEALRLAGDRAEELVASSLRERTLVEELKIASAIIERVHAPLPDGASETPAGQHNRLTTDALRCECVFCKRARTAAPPSEIRE